MDEDGVDNAQPGLVNRQLSIDESGMDHSSWSTLASSTRVRLITDMASLTDRRSLVSLPFLGKMDAYSALLIVVFMTFVFVRT